MAKKTLEHHRTKYLFKVWDPAPHPHWVIVLPGIAHIPAGREGDGKYIAQVVAPLIQDKPVGLVTATNPTLFSLTDIVGQLVELIQSLPSTNPPQIHLIGHSGGGIVTTLFLQHLYKYPQQEKQISSVVLIDTPFSYQDLALSYRFFNNIFKFFYQLKVLHRLSSYSMRSRFALSAFEQGNLVHEIDFKRKYHHTSLYIDFQPNKTIDYLYDIFPSALPPFQKLFPQGQIKRVVGEHPVIKPYTKDNVQKALQEFFSQEELFDSPNDLKINRNQ